MSASHSGIEVVELGGPNERVHEGRSLQYGASTIGGLAPGKIEAIVALEGVGLQNVGVAGQMPR
jgi:hypothetical protein